MTHSEYDFPTASNILPRSVVDLFFAAAVVWFGSYAYLYAFEFGGPKPLYSYILLCAFALALVALHASRLPPKQSGISSELCAFALAILLYVVYGHISFLISSQSGTAVQAFVTLVESAMFLMAMLIVLWHHRRIHLAKQLFVVLSIFAIALNAWDFVLPAFSNVPGRAAGLYENPNMSGTFIVLCMVAGSTIVPRRLRILYVALCGAGVLITFSRGSWLAWFVGIAWLLWNRDLPRLNARTIVGVLFLIILGGIAAVETIRGIGQTVEILMSSGLLTPNTAARLGIGGDVLSGFAAYDRLTVVKFSIDRMEEAPFFGHGLGYTAEWSYASGTHNIFLLQSVEGGVFGLGVLVFLLGAMWIAASARGKALVGLIVLSGLFSHNHMEQPTILLILAFVFAEGAFSRLPEHDSGGIKSGASS